MVQSIKDKILISGLLLLTLGISFLSGRISVKTEQLGATEDIADIGQVTETVPTINFSSFDKGIIYGKTNGKDLRVFVQDKMLEPQENGSFFIDTTSIQSAPTSDNGEKYLFVASKNSKVYHLIGSSAANRIDPKNKIYFLSAEEAKAKGFEPGSDVK